jgi:hypothetical protein
MQIGRPHSFLGIHLSCQKHGYWVVAVAALTVHSLLLLDTTDHEYPKMKMHLRTHFVEGNLKTDYVPPVRRILISWVLQALPELLNKLRK